MCNHDANQTPILLGSNHHECEKLRCTPKTSDAGVAAELQAMIFLVDWQSILFTNNLSSETESFPFPFFSYL